MKVSMLKVVTLASVASATQAALLCTTDAFCATAHTGKPYCIYTAADASACAAALIASGTACFVKSTKDSIQCAATDFCDYGHATVKQCKTKILKTVAAEGSTDDEKKHSCKSGEVDSSGNCNPASDAGCTAEGGATPSFFGIPSTGGTAACAAGIARAANCFQISTPTTNQCVATDYCPSATGACAVKIAVGAAVPTTAGITDEQKKASCASGAFSGANCAATTDAECEAADSTNPYYVQSAQGTGACAPVGSLKAVDAACFPLAGTIQCATTAECISQTATTFACKTKATNDATCNTISASTLPYFVKATATGVSACQATGLANNALCFIKTTAAASQCATGHYCPATSDAATNKCKPKVATGGACVTADLSGQDCLSGTCTSNVCVGIALGSACTSTQACVANSYCDTTCKALVAADAACVAGSSVCVANTTCVVTNATASNTTGLCKAPTPAPTTAPPTNGTNTSPTAAATTPTAAKSDHSSALSLSSAPIILAALMVGLGSMNN